MVYSQLLDFLDRNHFNYLVRKYDGDKYVKNYSIGASQDGTCGTVSIEPGANVTQN